MRISASAAAATILIALAAGAAPAQATAAESRSPATVPSSLGQSLHQPGARPPIAVAGTPWIGDHRHAGYSLAETLLLGSLEPLSPAPGVLQLSDNAVGHPPVLPRLGTRPPEEDRPSWPLWTGLLLTGAAVAIQYDRLEADESRRTKADPGDEGAPSVPLTETRQSSDDSDSLRNTSFTIGAAGLVLLAYYFLGADPAPEAATADSEQGAGGALQLALAHDQAAVGWGWRW